MLDLATQLRDYLDETALAVELEDIVAGPTGDGPVRPLGPRRPGRPLTAWAYGVAAAFVVLLLVGGAALVIRGDPNDDPTDPTIVPTTTVPTTVVETSIPPPPVGAGGVVEPGSWSVAAGFTDPSTSAESLPDLVAEVSSWTGVLGVAAAPDDSAWRQLIGDSACDDDGFAAVCGVGIVVLVTLPWTDETALRLETESGMTAVTALEAPSVFWDGYASKARSSPAPSLSFDPVSHGLEVAAEELGSGIRVQTEGAALSAAVGRNPDGTLVLDTSSGGTGFSIADLLIDGQGRGGVLAILDQTTDLEAGSDPRRIYALAGLPLDAAVVATELTDGTRVWQRPSAGMVLFLDNVGSVPDEYVAWNTSGGELESPPPFLPPANPLSVLDSEGVEIMRIEDLGPGQTRITDLRFDADVIRDDRATPAPPSRAFPEPMVSSPIVIHASDGTTTLEVSPWVSHQVATEDAVWVRSPGDGGVVRRIDATTLQVTDTVESSGWDLFVAAGGLWSVDRQSVQNLQQGSVVRIDLDTRQITDTVVIESPNGQLPAPVQLGDSLWFPYYRDGAFLLEIDLEAGTIVNEWQVQTEWGADWSTAIEGAIWSWTPGEGVSRFDPLTGERNVYPEGAFPEWGYSDVCCVHTDDAIFLVHPEGLVARFDLATRVVTATLQLEGAGLGVVADGALWIPATRPFVDEGVVYRIDPFSLEVVDVINVGPRLWERPVVGAGALWVHGWTANAGATVVARIDLDSRQVTHIIEGGNWAPVFLDGSVWIPRGDGRLARIDLP